MSTVTPLMQQYFHTKEQYPDTLLFFQVGDFYELFFEDAQQASHFLGIALTTRGKHNGEPIPLCGVPLHAINHHMAKLIKGGFKVALCDQLEPAQAGRVVKRGVTQVITPGMVTDSSLLDEKSASYLFSCFATQDQWGIVCAELLTAQLFATVIPASHRMLETELARFFPDELLVPDSQKKVLGPIAKRSGYTSTVVPSRMVDEGAAEQWMQGQFTQDVCHAFEREEGLRKALYYFYAYLARNQRAALEQFGQVTLYQPDDFLLLDHATQRNLDLLRNSSDGTHKHTLFEQLDCAASPMGSRMIKKWIQRPLVAKEAIVQRQDAVEALRANVPALQLLQTVFGRMGDVERMVGRILLGRASIQDFIRLCTALRCIPELVQVLDELRQHTNSGALFAIIQAHMDGLGPLCELLQRAFSGEHVPDRIIAPGFDEDLDRMRELVTNSHDKILALERCEQERTGIQSLKVRFNTVHGYYIEVTKANAHLVPDSFVRQQTLVGKERFMTPELQELQADIMTARAQFEQREKDIFDEVKRRVNTYGVQLRKYVHALSHLDALFGFAHAAYSRGYVRPTFNDQGSIEIINGRHPVVEAIQKPFVANSTALNDEQSLMIITGPNMGGKSTYLRQVALLSIMAQCGSFVSAERADVFLCDRIFTRIGAGDNLAEGKSTFLVEMEEVTTICTQSTEKSLVILDEVGRGTSTFDGLALAQAIVEFIYQKVKARCLFATHYHELTNLDQEFSGIKSYRMDCRKTEAGIVFLHTIRQGAADGSFGVEVARLAGVPETVISRSEQLLKGYKQEQPGVAVLPARVCSCTDAVAHKDTEPEVHRVGVEDEQRLGLVDEGRSATFQAQVLRALGEVDLNNLTPRQAFDLLYQWKEQL